MQSEMNQLHKRKVFEAINPSDLTYKGKKGPWRAETEFLTCANGSIQRNYIAKDGASSPTVSTDSVLITSVIEARQIRDS